MKNKLDILRHEIQEALADVEARHGVRFKLGSMTYNQTYFRATLECNVKGTLTREQQEYDRKAAYHNLPPRGAAVKCEGKVYEIIEWKTRSSKYPIILKDLDGRRIKVTVNYLKSLPVLATK